LLDTETGGAELLSIAFSFFIGCKPLLHTVMLIRRPLQVRSLPQLAPEGLERGTEPKQ